MVELRLIGWKNKKLKDDLKQKDNLFSFLAELCIYHTAFKSKVIGSEWKGGR